MVHADLRTFAVLATGQSMSQSIADFVRGRCRVVAVSDAYKLAPWADALASVDAAWWRHNQEAFEFKGRKFTYAPGQGFSQLERIPGITSGMNSGLFAVKVAVHMGANRVLLYGFDMRGTHYFGPHKKLRNTKPERFETFKRQFAAYNPPGVEIINCTPGSALKCYPTADLEDCLAEPALHAA